MNTFLASPLWLTIQVSVLFSVFCWSIVYILTDKYFSMVELLEEPRHKFTQVD